MGVFGYIFLAGDKEYLVSSAAQQKALLEYAQSIGIQISEMYFEEESPLQQPFLERPKGGALHQQCRPGDAIITMKAEWILGCSAAEAERLLQQLGIDQIALHCVDLGGNISVPEKRRLAVTEGSAQLVKKLLTALSVCENSRRGQDMKTAKSHRKQQGKYLGGPVPFGWEVNSAGFLVKNEVQQGIIAKIEAMRTERWSYREISGKLQEEFNIHLSHEGVRKILAGNTQRKMSAKER